MIRFACSLAFSSLLIAQTSPPLAVTPNPAAVVQGQTLLFTSNKPVTWSLAKGSAGTLIATSPTSATYQAPPVVAPQGVELGCQTTPSDSVFNTPIDTLPVDANSASAIAGMVNGTQLAISPDFGINIVDASTPMQNETFYYTPGNQTAPYPRPALETRERQAGSFQTVFVSGSADRHMMSLDPRSCTFYEMYGDYFQKQPTPARGCGTAAKPCTATSGVQYVWSSYALPNGGTTQASNLLYQPMLIRLAEFKAGEIRHALSFVYAQYQMKRTLPSGVWPANSTLEQGTSGPSYGQRFRLKATYDISKFSKNAQVILTALQKYGAFLTDAAPGGMTLYADADTSQDPAALSAFGEIWGAKIMPSAFEIVDESSFMVSKASSQVNPDNPYQAPINYAVLTAAPASGNPISLPIALGSHVPTPARTKITILAGVSYKLPAWKGGTSNVNDLNWKLISGPGSVSADGVYAAPASVSAPTAAVLQVASCANPSLASNVYVTVLPANADGSIRIDAGSTVPTKSADGKLWLADAGYQGTTDHLVGDYPAWHATGNVAATQYRTYHYTNGADLTYRFIVPNGNYKVRLLLGAPFNGHSTQATYDPTVAWMSWGPYHLIANGAIAAHNFDFGVPINHATGVPSDAYVPARVTDNTLTVSVRGNRPDSTPVLPEVMPVLSGLEIVPDASVPHLAIDAQQQTSVAGGTTLQLYAIGWYMPNSVQWNLVNSPGSIDQNGLYTAPAAISVPQTVTIQATSTGSGHVSATLNLTIPAA